MKQEEDSINVCDENAEKILPFFVKCLGMTNRLRDDVRFKAHVKKKLCCVYHKNEACEFLVKARESSWIFFHITDCVCKNCRIKFSPREKDRGISQINKQLRLTRKTCLQGKVRGIFQHKSKRILTSGSRRKIPKNKTNQNKIISSDSRMIKDNSYNHGLQNQSVSYYHNHVIVVCFVSQLTVSKRRYLATEPQASNEFIRNQNIPVKQKFPKGYESLLTTASYDINEDDGGPVSANLRNKQSSMTPMFNDAVNAGLFLSADSESNNSLTSEATELCPIQTAYDANRRSLLSQFNVDELIFSGVDLLDCLLNDGNMKL